jgi:hypothetical protein
MDNMSYYKEISIIVRSCIKHNITVIVMSIYHDLSHIYHDLSHIYHDLSHKGHWLITLTLYYIDKFVKRTCAS